MSIDVEFSRDMGEIVDGEIWDDARSASSQHGSARERTRARHDAGGRRGWRRVLGALGVSGAGGSAVFTYYTHPLFMAMGVALSAAVVLFGLVSLGLLLWTLVYGGDGPREQAFRLMRFASDREEPPAPEFAMVPAQASRAGVLPGGGAGVGSHAITAMTHPGLPGTAVRHCRHAARGR